METTQQPIQFRITEGPGREYLWLALAYANELSDPYVEFTLASHSFGSDISDGETKTDWITDGDSYQKKGQKLGTVMTFDITPKKRKRKFILNSLGREDGSGNNWLIELVLVNPEEGESSNWSGYYNSRTRTGFLTLPAK